MVPRAQTAKAVAGATFNQSSRNRFSYFHRPSASAGPPMVRQNNIVFFFDGRLSDRGLLVTTLRPNVALELHHVTRWIDHHEGLMLVSAVGESSCGAHQEFDAQFLEMIFQPGKIFHMQQGKAVMPGVGARVGRDRTPLQVTYQLQDAAEAEGDAVLEDTHGLCPEDFRVPAGGLLEVAAWHGDVRNITSRRDRGVVQQAGGGLEPRVAQRGYGLLSTLGHDCRVLAQSATIFASRMTSAHLRSSPFTTRSSSSGVEPTGSPPCSSSLCFTSGSWIVRAISCCIRATIAAGVFAGANIAYQES